jgi:hypothetical protein
MTVKRLPSWREIELDTEYAMEGEICHVCKRPIAKWVQVGTGWSSGYYEKCLHCNESHFRSAHDYCVPLCVKGYSWLNKLACWLKKDCDDGKLLVRCCENCREAEPTASES